MCQLFRVSVVLRVATNPNVQLPAHPGTELHVCTHTEGPPNPSPGLRMCTFWDRVVGHPVYPLGFI